MQDVTAPGPSLHVVDQPDEATLQTIVDELNRLDEPVDVSIALAKRARRPIRGCGLHPHTLTLRRGSKANAYPALTNGSSRSFSELFTLLRVVHVDADGSPRSYHPDDPLGRGQCSVVTSNNGQTSITGACALDAFASGGLYVFKGGRRLSGPELASNWSQLWQLVRERRIGPINGDRRPLKRLVRSYYGFSSPDLRVTGMMKRDIIPQARSGYPCVYEPSAPYPGYFVSATALTSSVTRSEAWAPPECRAESFTNAERIPFFVLPLSGVGSLRLGDVVVASTGAEGNERVVFGVVGDLGPGHQLGEGSIAFLQELLDRKGQFVPSGLAVNSLDIGRDARKEIALLILGGTSGHFGGDYSYEKIQSIAKREFSNWGGHEPMKRVRACIAQIKSGR